MARTPRQSLGDAAEALVAERLVGRGWRLLGRQVHVGHGELDIVAVDPGPPARLVVVEVRWRADRSFGLPEETFDGRKRGHLRRALGRLLADGRLPDGTALPALPIALDLVVLEPPAGLGVEPRMRHHRDALGG